MSGAYWRRFRPEPTGTYPRRVPDDASDHADDEPPATNPLPFVIALVVFAIVAVLSYVFLRDDEPGRLAAPDGIQVVGPDTVRLRYDGPFPEGDADIIQVGYALGDDVVYVELVVDDHGCAAGTDCPSPTDSLTVDLVLPEPIAGRRVRHGTGRALADCDRSTPVPVCR